MPPSPKRRMWDEAFEQAPIRMARGEAPFTMSEVRAAGNWPTCACGTADPRIPRDGGECPQDDELTGLGIAFLDEVRGANQDFYDGAIELAQEHVNEAKGIMAHIVERAEIVITAALLAEEEGR